MAAAAALVLHAAAGTAWGAGTAAAHTAAVGAHRTAAAVGACAAGAAVVLAAPVAAAVADRAEGEVVQSPEGVVAQLAGHSRLQTAPIGRRYGLCLLGLGRHTPGCCLREQQSGHVLMRDLT